MFSVLILEIQWVELMNKEMVKPLHLLQMNCQLVYSPDWESDSHSNDYSGFHSSPNWRTNLIKEGRRMVRSHLKAGVDVLKPKTRGQGAIGSAADVNSEEKKS